MYLQMSFFLVNAVLPSQPNYSSENSNIPVKVVFRTQSNYGSENNKMPVNVGFPS